MSETDGSYQQSPIPGWYPLEGELRWWDGRQWTDHRQPGPEPQPPVDRGWAPAPAYATPLTDARTSSAEIVVAWVITVLTAAYMLP